MAPARVEKSKRVKATRVEEMDEGQVLPLLGTRAHSIPTSYDRYFPNKSLGQSKIFSSDLIQMRFFQYNIALQPIESPLA